MYRHHKFFGRGIKPACSDSFRLVKYFVYLLNTFLSELLSVNSEQTNNKKHLFFFRINHQDGVTPTDGSSDNYANCFSKGAIGCADWILKYDNMDYLKADANGKCPNNTVLNGTTNTTCK